MPVAVPSEYAPRRVLLVLALVAGLLGYAAFAVQVEPAAAKKSGGRPGNGGGSQPKAVPNSTLKIKPHGLSKGRAGITSKVTVGGSLSPYRKGQRVQVYFFHNAKRFSLRRVKVKKGKGNYGTFRTRVATRKGGKYAAQAKYFGQAGKDPVNRDTTVRKSWKVRFRGVHKGQCGRVVRGFRKALNRLAFVPSNGKCFDGSMERAVLAYRKSNNLTRNAHASKAIVKNVFNGKGRYRVRKSALGDHVEAPLSRQVIVFARGKKPYAIFPTSSGTPVTPTILGTYSFYWKDPGYNEKGMYMSSYFIRGYAIHGYQSVPNYPASHGCLRTFIADQPRIYNMTSLGQSIYTYGRGRSLDGLSGLDSDLKLGPDADLGPDLGPSGGLRPGSFDG
ncbi:MAG: L,D-transpeptidase [Thermoleophilia bacterium]|nr:L,D-transpeptidase [Thermoleophilia bacterium]